MTAWAIFMVGLCGEKAGYCYCGGGAFYRFDQAGRNGVAYAEKTPAPLACTVVDGLA